jgi:DNA glycosylase AlkZ-like
MQALTGPRVHAANAHYYRKCGLDSRLLARSRAVLERALQGGNDLTRSDLARVLRRSGIEADGMRLAYLVMHAELDAVICSGPRRGKQFTYALLEERVPQARVLEREEALAELTRRYFSSHGPATLRDYVWWSGLTVRDAKAGLDSVKPALVHESSGGRSYWFVAARFSAASASECTHLLPNYDEYLIAYKDREPVVAPRRAGITSVRGDMFAHQLVIDGLLAGRWTRGKGASSVRLEVAPYRRLTRDEARSIAAAADRYGRFMKLATDVRIVQP